jgi:hypothetical protein
MRTAWLSAIGRRRRYPPSSTVSGDFELKLRFAPRPQGADAEVAEYLRFDAAQAPRDLVSIERGSGKLSPKLATQQ